MAYSRRSFRRRRYGRRRSYRRRSSSWGNTAWNLAKRAASGVVKYYLNPEYKFLDWNATTMAPSTTPEVYGDPSWLAAGTTETTRTGSTIKLTSLQAHIVMQKKEAATATLIRIVFVTDISSNGLAPTWLDVFESTSINTFINKDYGRRFRVLYDRSYVLDTDNPIRTVSMYKKLQHHIKYLNSNSGDTALGQGAIYFMIVSNETGVGVPTVSIKTRARFLDN